MRWPTTATIMVLAPGTGIVSRRKRKRRAEKRLDKLTQMLYIVNMKSKVYGIRLNEKQRKQIEEKAQAMGLTVASYLRHLAITAKKRAGRITGSHDPGQSDPDKDLRPA